MKTNIMSIDLESWVQGHEYLNLSSQERKNLDGEDILRESYFLLNQLSIRNIKLTWYVVAEIETWYPYLIEDIAREGHEIGYHTYSHEMIFSDKVFGEQLQKSKDFLLKYRPVSFQAPAINFYKNGYALLKKHGFLYSLSTYGESANLYNVGDIIECPVSTYFFLNGQSNSHMEYPSNMKKCLSKGGVTFGSSFWYAMGFPFIKYFMMQSLKRGSFLNMFIHNWQLYPPSKSAQLSKRKFCRRMPGLIMYLPNVSKIFFKMMDDFSWDRADKVLKNQKSSSF